MSILNNYRINFFGGIEVDVSVPNNKATYPVDGQKHDIFNPATSTLTDFIYKHGISDEEIIDMARIFKITTAKLYYGLNNPDYNYTIRSIPTDQEQTDYYHWYVAIIPRVSVPAGFELGSGMFINTSLPEESAEFLRSVDIPSEPIK